MKRSFVALLGAPLVLAACVVTEPTGSAGPKPVIVSPGGGAAPIVVPPKTGTGGTTVVVPETMNAPGGSTVVVSPPTVVSTDLAALAGTYDNSPNACRSPAGSGRVTITPSSLTLGARECLIQSTARDGSALRFQLACTQGSQSTAAVATEAVITRSAQGITLRDGTSGPMSKVKCAS